jgi:hypothetical protein
LATTTMKSATRLVLTQILEPLRANSAPSRSAVVPFPQRRFPALCSLIAEPQAISPSKTGRIRLLPLLAKLKDHLRAELPLQDSGSDTPVS